jgi:butyryl-CoA dehydrogenase
MTRRERTMGLRGMPEGEIAIRDLVVPDEYVLRPPGGFERGFAALMNAYNSQRVGAGAAAMGVAAGATELTIEWLGKRKQFGRPLAEFQGLQWMLADMEIATTSSRLMLHAAAASQGPDQSGFPDPKLAAMAKVQAAESAIATVNTALQLHGARGYGGEFPIERMARDVRMFTIGGGTAEALRTLIASQTLGRKFPQTRDGYVAG